MLPIRHGSLKTSIVCEKKVLVVDFTKATLFVQRLVGYQMPAKLSNTERIMKAIGMASYLSNRSAPFIINNLTLL
jgi:hypothetical protein